MASTPVDQPAPRTKQLAFVGGAILAAAAFGAFVYHHHSGEAAHAHGEKAAAREHHDHGEHALAGGLWALSLDDGEKWPTDDPLRAGMNRMHDAAVAALGPYKAGTLSAAQASTLAAAIDRELAFLVANCKLEPKADAQLHLILGEIVSGGAAAEADPASTEGVPRVAKALHAYLEHFDHPGGFQGT